MKYLLIGMGICMIFSAGFVFGAVMAAYGAKDKELEIKEAAGRSVERAHAAGMEVGHEAGTITGYRNGYAAGRVDGEQAVQARILAAQILERGDQ